ncbi:MAG TPA: hypothetical protein VK968_20370, partial [Roseimicrobium sp.]|nr:hypothetical protein [Roseimicrobium sp.]
WDLSIHPKMTRPTGAQFYWQRLQHWGVMPRAAAVNGPNDYFQWTQATLTGGQNVRFDGVFGAGIEAGQSWYAMKNAPSLSQSQIDAISDVIMISESGNWDNWWGIYAKDTQMGFCANWGPGWSAPGKSDIFGPHARKRSKVPQEGCRYPNGMTIYVATDGSAKALDYRGKILERTQRADGTWILKRMWSGQQG